MISDGALEDRLRRTYRAVAEATTLTDDLDARAAPAIDDRDPGDRWPRRWPVVLGAFLVSGLVVAGVALAAGVGGSSRHPSATRTEPPSTVSPMPASAREALRHALGLWATFPADAARRPLVLTSDAVVAPSSGFGSTDEKEAFLSGAFSEPARYPPAPDRAEGYPLVTAEAAFETMRAEGSPGGGTPRPPTPLAVAEVRLGSASFATDRGARELPAWLFSFQGVRDPAAVLAVAPSERFPVPAGAQHVGSLGARLEPGGRTATITFTGAPLTGPCSEDYTIDELASDHAVAISLRTIRSPDPGVVCASVGYPRQVQIVLSSPLGDRVLVDAATGGPVVVDG